MSSNVKDIIIGSVLIAASFFVPGSGMIASFIASMLFTFGASYALQGISRAFLSQKVEGIKANILSTQASVPVIYGTMRVGIQVADTMVINSGLSWTPNADPDAVFNDADDDDVLLRVGSLCQTSENGSGIEDVDNIRFDREPDDAIVAPLIGAAMSNFGVQDPYTDHTKYLIRNGADTQIVPTDLANQAGWSSDMKGVGVAYIALFLKYDQDKWRGGVPDVTVLVKGNKVFDPRSVTWAWSDNPALCALDYIASKRYGWGRPYAGRDGGTDNEIDEQSFIDGANYCDDLVSVGGAPEQKRFRLNGAIDTSVEPLENLTQMLSSCRGEIVYQGGMYRLVIRQPTVAETFELNDSNIVGEWEFVRRGADVPNIIEGTFVDGRNGDYIAQSVIWPLVGDLTYINADNGVENRIEVDLPFTTDYYQALQTIMVLLREDREDILVSVTATQEALKLQVGEVVKVTHVTPGWTAKEFWVAGMALRPDGLVRLALAEYSSSAYSLDSLAARDELPGTNLPNPFMVLAPSNLVLTSDSSTALVTQDGQRIPTILADWSESRDPFLDHYEVYYKLHSASVWYQSFDVPRTQTSAIITPVTDGEVYDVRVVAVNHLSVRSDFSAAGANATVTVGTLPGVDVANALDNFREVARDDVSITYRWEPGIDVDTIWVYENLVKQPVISDPWPSGGIEGTDNLVAVLDASVTKQYVVSIPPPGYVRYVQFEPMNDAGVEGPHRRVLVLPLLEEPDTIATLDVIVNDVDGSVAIRAETNALSGSVRFAYAIGSAPSWPTIPSVEAGTVVVVSSAAASLTLPAGTVGLGEKIRVRATAYINADGTGYLGVVTEHGVIVNAEDDRTKFRVPKIEIVTESEDGTNGSITVKVWDPDNLVTNLYYCVKSGSSAWGAWTLKVADPATGSTHTETVALQQGHMSFVQFRLDYLLGGESGSDTITSGGFDKGRIASGSFHPVLNEDAQAATGWAIGDVDTTGWKVVAGTSEASVSEADVDASVTISGRILTPAQVGVLVSGLSLGDDVWFGWKPQGPGGNGPYAKTSLKFLNIAPTIRSTTESESATDGTMGVTVSDPGGQADTLEYRTKSGGAAWSAWADAVGAGAPPNDGVEYQRTVTLVDGHLSFIQFRLTFTLRGAIQVLTATSGGFDKGTVPGGSVKIYIDANRNMYAIATGEFDTAKWKIGASKVSAAAAAAAATAATPIVGRNLDPTSFGAPLLSAVVYEHLFLAGIPIGPDDVEGLVVTDELYYTVERNKILSAWLEFEVVAGVRQVRAFWNLVTADGTGSLKLSVTTDGGAPAVTKVNAPAKDGSAVVITPGVLKSTYVLTATPYTAADYGGVAGSDVVYTLTYQPPVITSLAAVLSLVDVAGVLKLQVDLNYQIGPGVASLRITQGFSAWETDITVGESGQYTVPITYSLLHSTLLFTVRPYDAAGGSGGGGHSGDPLTVTVEARQTETNVLVATGSGGMVSSKFELEAGAGVDLEQGTTSEKLRIKAHRTISTSDPSGTPADGEEWVKYAP